MSSERGAVIRGIGQPLPPGEHVLWVGAPHRAALSRHFFRSRWLAAYFGALLLLRALTALDDPSPRALIVDAATWLVPLGLCLALFAEALAALVAATTVYAITDRRVVMKVGIALDLVINVPLSNISSAALRERKDGTGDIILSLAGADRVAYLLLWPHARAWQLARPEPMLRGIEQARAVARQLCEAATLGDAATPAADDRRLVLATEMSPVTQGRVARVAPAEAPSEPAHTASALAGR